MSPRRSNPDSELHIKRIDSERKNGGGGTHGFQVCFHRSDVFYTRLFSDSTCGGKEEAREAARKYRPILEAAIPARKIELGFRTGKARSNTGRMGVSISSTERADGSIYTFVQATVRIATRVAKNKKFAIQDNDLKGTIELAHQWRQTLLTERDEPHVAQSSTTAS